MNVQGKAALVAAGLLVAGHAAAQAPTAVAQQVEVDEGAPPRPIEGVAASYRTPPRDAAGAYITPNRDVSPEQATWHVRVALNVAALGCRDADERATVAAYNAMLATARDQLAAAATGTERRYQLKFGAKWRAAYDDNMTRLYNFFAQTPAHDEFCAAAKAVLAETQAVAPADFARVTQAALPRLEASFLAFYARYDSYREEVAAWQARHTVRVVVAAAAPPVALVSDAPAVMAAAATPPVVIAAAAPTTPPIMVAAVSTMK